MYEPLAFFLSGLAVFALFVICKAFHNRCRLNDTEFRQAGVVVNFRDSTVKIKRRVYPVGVIKSWNSEAEYGKIILNGSFAYLYLNDFKYPMHTVSFLTTKGAEVFLHRLSLAIEHCYTYQAQNDAAAAE